MSIPMLETPAPALERRKARKAVAWYLAAVFVVSAFLWGYEIGASRSGEATASASGTVEVVGKGENRASEKIDFAQFWDVWETVRTEYARQPVDEKRLYQGALAGMVASLGDPHSMYLEPKAAEEFTQELSGRFEGIGAEIGMKKDQIVVVAPLPDSPAEKAGLKAGDRILAIGDRETSALSVDGAVELIRGPKGTTVKLVIGRTGQAKPLTVEIVRDTISVKSVKYSRVTSPQGKRLAVIQITNFNGDTVELFLDAVSKIKPGETDGVILDLRNDPGGYLDGAIRVLGEWIPGQVAVSERFADGTKEDHRTNGRGRLADVPTIVLVNGGSASASEIVAGALQDTGKAKLIGTQTFGKGSVQDLIDLKDGASLKLTIALWYTPNGRNIDSDGIAPDHVVERTDEDYDADRDPQMDAAKAFFDGVVPKAAEPAPKP